MFLSPSLPPLSLPPSPSLSSSSSLPTSSSHPPDPSLPRRFIETYLKPYPGLYLSGDLCRRRQDGLLQVPHMVSLHVFNTVHVCSYAFLACDLCPKHQLASTPVLYVSYICICAAGHRVSRPRGTGSVGDSAGEGWRAVGVQLA